MGFFWIVLAACLTWTDIAWSPPNALGQGPEPSRALSGQELLGIAEIHDAQNHYQEARSYYERAVVAFQAGKQRRGEATAQQKLGLMLLRQAKWEEAYTALKKAEALLDRSADHAAQARTALALGQAAAALDKLDEAAGAYQKAEALARKSRDVKTLNEFRLLLGSLRIVQGRTEEGRALLRAALEDARHRHDGSQQLAALLALADGENRAHDAAQARRLYEEALSLAEAERNIKSEAEARGKLASLALTEGCPAEGIPVAKRALAIYQTVKDRAREAETLALLSRLHRASGQSTEAEEYKRQAVTIRRTYHLPMDTVDQE